MNGNLLEYLSLNEIQAIEPKSHKLALIRTSAIEQHGPHLPLGTDAILNNAWLKYASKHFPNPSPVYVGPHISIGNSIEHLAFPGTLSLRTKSYQNQLEASIRQLASWGFTNILVLNTHGGNNSINQFTCNELRHELGINLHRLHWYYMPDGSDPTDIHAGDLETSLIMALDANYIRGPLPPPPPSITRTGAIQYTHASVQAGWATHDLAPAGILGNPTLATPEKGQKLFDDGSKLLSTKILGYIP